MKIIRVKPLYFRAFGDNPHGGVPLVREIHENHPDFPVEDGQLFSAAYTVNGIANLAQVPVVVNHLHRYISFGSENPQLSFKYTLPDGDHKDEK